MSVSDVANLKIAFVGPIASGDRPPRGGFEAANRRVIEALRRRGAIVTEFHYPPTSHLSAISKTIAYSGFFIKTAVTLLFGHADFDLVHFTPVHKYFIYPEVVLAAIVRLRRLPLFYEIRAGNYLSEINEFSPLYRKACGALARLAGYVGVQGDPVIPVLRRIGARAVDVFPNFVDDSFLIANCVDAAAPVKLIYFGRITAPKGIDVVIETAAHLTRLGIENRLTVFGEGMPDELAEFQSRASEVDVEWRGPTAHADVPFVVRGHHFFVFPSRHSGEGQSNALTEAMAIGVVPIASAQGFSASVVGDAGVIMPIEATGADYARAIAVVWETGVWRAKSEAARARIRRSFCEYRVIAKLTDAYLQITGVQAQASVRAPSAGARR